MTESAYDMDGVTKDSTEYIVKIKVTDNSTGVLAVERVDEIAALDFTNTYDAKGDITLGGKKYIDKRDFVEGDSATMKIEAITTGAPMPTPSEVTVEPTEGTSIDYAFGKIEYKLSDLPEGFNSNKTFEYKVTESTFSMKGVTKDITEYIVKIKVTDNSTGVLAVERVDGIEALDFTNTYDAKGDITLGGTKYIDKRDFVEGDSATMKIVALTENAPMPTPSEVTVEPTEGTSIDYTFGKIEYKLSDLPDGFNSNKTFEYKVTESTFSMKGVTKDINEYIVKIKVTDNSTGVLAVERVDGIAALDFTNTYEATGDIQLYAKKELIGRDLKAGEFKFRLFRVETDADGKETLEPVFGDKLFENEANGLIKFDKIEYTQDDMQGLDYDLDADNKPVSRTKTIVYRMVEVVGDDKTVIYDTKPVDDITVTLVDDLAGTIHTSAIPDATKPEDSMIVCFFRNIVTNILKVAADENGNVLKDANGNDKALKNAVIKVYDDTATDPLVFTITTDTTPTQIENLEVGKTYRLHEESAPYGYLPWAFDAWFTVDADGNITVGEIDSTGMQPATANSIIWVENGVIKVKDTMKKVTASVHKVWDDDDNRDGLRPTATGIKVNLLRDGEVYRQGIELNTSNNWTAMATDLPAGHVEDGVLVDYEYTWAEPAVIGYDLDPANSNFVEVTLSSTLAGKATLTTITNKHTPGPTEVSVTKVWVDNGKHPDKVKVQLYADEQAYGDEVILSAPDWSYTWKDLPKNTNPTGAYACAKEIVYTVAETEIPEGYIAKVTGNAATGFVITNTFETGKLVIEKEFKVDPWEPFGPDDSPLDIPVTKTWNDDNNKDGNRPEAITVRLLADGTEVANAQLNEANGWKYTFTGLPRLTDTKERIVYTITEDPVEWYEAEIRGYNIRNNYKPELTSVSVQKVWDDNNNAQKLRPTSIAMTLSNGMIVVLNATNNWTATIDNLPTRVNGQPVTYTWTEQKVLNYDKTGEVTEGNLTIFTNKVYTRPTPTTGTRKTPPTAGEPLEVLEDYETPLGVEVIINHVGDCFD